MSSLFRKSPPKEIELQRFRYLYDNFRYLTVFGGSYGFYHTPKWAAISLSVYIVMYTVTILATLNCLYASYLVRINVSAFSQCFHVFIVGLVVLSASLTLTSLRRRVKPFLDLFVNPHVCEYSVSPYHRRLAQEARKKKNVLLIIWTCGYGSCGLAALLNIIIDDSIGHNLTMNVTDVYWKKIPVMFWWPLDAHETSVGWITLVLFEGACALFFPVMVISGTMLCFTAADQLLNQLKLLSHAVKNLEQRATAEFKRRFPGISPKTAVEEYDCCYYECIKQNVRHHHKIIDFTDLFLDLGSMPIGVPFFGGALLLGLAGLNMTADDDPRIGPKILMCLLALTEAFNMYMLCVYGEAFQEASKAVFDATFHTNWYPRSMKCKRALIIFRYGTIKPIEITALKLIVLNMETFSNLVNSAYSIFNLRSISND